MSSQEQDKLEPVKNWSYPVPSKNSSGSVDPDAYMAAFKASDGTYPIGLNGLWHGGIHFDQDDGTADSSAALLDEVGGIRCIADGEVVAYKLDSDYLPLTYPDGRNGLFSSSFTLVKHKLTLPLPPPATPSVTPASALTSQSPGASNAQPADPAPTVPVGSAVTPAAANTVSTDPADTLIFFSLYMHLAACKVYKQSGEDRTKKAWPSYYNAVETYTLDAEHAEDSQTGVTMGEPIKGLHVHRGGRGSSRDWLGILSQGSKFTVTRPRNAHNNWGKIVSISEGEVKPLTPTSIVGPAAEHGFVYLKNLRSEIKPDSLDAVYVLPRPIKINAGDVVGYLGEFQNAEHATLLPPSPKRALVHLEVFAGDDLDTFISRSRQRAAQLTTEPKTQLLIEKGASLYKETPVAPGTVSIPKHATVVATHDAPKSGTWTKVKVTGGAPELYNQTYWILRSALGSTQGSRATWSEFPLSLSGAVVGTAAYTRVLNVSRLLANEDDANNAWYEVDVGDADMKTVTGYVRAPGQPKVSLQNKWAWAGFELLSSQLSNEDLFKRFLYLKGGSATAAEESAFEASFNAAESDPLIQKLDDILTPQNQPKGKIAGANLLAAMNIPWRASRVGHLVVKYESEWGGPREKWTALDSIMNSGKTYWDVEKGRIESLKIWDACKNVNGFVKALVYHLHPIALIGTFSGGRRRHDVDLGKLSSHFETGGRGSITISGGQGDPGGVSYGSYQMTSQTRQQNGSFIIGGTVKKFVTSVSFPWSNDFDNLVPGTRSFSDKWTQTVEANEDRFKEVEHEFVRNTHFDIQIKTVMDATGVDLRYHSHAVNDVVWSTSVQHGPTTDVIATAIKNLDAVPTESKEYDAQLIAAIYAERGAKDSHGTLIRFRHSGRAEQTNIVQRFIDENIKAQNEIKNENY
jgi:hypothetical protein